jgi:hypothetical protein
MHCVAIAEQLLARDDDLELHDEVAGHIAGCDRCSTLARRLGRLEQVLHSRLIVEPPLELQMRLVELARVAARPAPVEDRLSWLQRLRAWLVDGLLLARPNVAIAQSLAALMLVLAGWQVLGWLNTFTPVLGDVPYAMELVASSPAAAYLSGFQPFDGQSLLLWSGIGIVGWLVSESGPVGRSRGVG